MFSCLIMTLLTVSRIRFIFLIVQRESAASFDVSLVSLRTLGFLFIFTRRETLIVLCQNRQNLCPNFSFAMFRVFHHHTLSL
jgi:hypothetical protein